MYFSRNCLGAPAAAPAAAPAPAAAAPPTPTPPPIAAAPAAPAAPRPLTAVEQRGPRVYASPMAKRLAEAQALRLEGQGSGVYGSITSQDLGSLSGAAASAGPAAPVSIPAGAAYVDIPVSNTRAVIAKRLLESKVTIPHYYLTVDINVDKVSGFHELLHQPVSVLLISNCLFFSLQKFVQSSTSN